MTTQKEASHPLFYRVGSRRTHRRVVAGMYGGWLLIALIVTLWSITSRGWFSSMELVLIASTVFQIIWYVWLGRTYVNAPRLADLELDERLVQVKNRAYRHAYLVFAPVAAIAWLVSLAAVEWQRNDQGKVEATVLLFAVAMLGGTLPTAIVAWQEPDPEPWTG